MLYSLLISAVIDIMMPNPFLSSFSHCALNGVLNVDKILTIAFGTVKRQDQFLCFILNIKNSPASTIIKHRH